MSADGLSPCVSELPNNEVKKAVIPEIIGVTVYSGYLKQITTVIKANKQ